jgi:hypothetical protein
VCIPSYAHDTHIVGAATIVRDTTSAQEGLVPRYLEALCTTPIFCDAFWEPGNVAKYDGKSNPSVLLEDYHLTC